MAVIETRCGADGVQRFDTAYHPGTSSYTQWYGMTDADLITKHAAEVSVKRYMTNVASYVDSANVRRHIATFSSAGPATVVYSNQTRSQLTSTWTTNSGAGYRLTSIEPMFKGVLPSSANYGTGLTGRYRIPTLSLGGLPWTGTNNTIKLGNSRSTTTPGMLFLGVTSLNVPFLGGTLLVNPLISIPVTVPGSGLNLPVFVPADPTLDGTTLFAQLAEE